MESVKKNSASHIHSASPACGCSHTPAQEHGHTHSCDSQEHTHACCQGAHAQEEDCGCGHEHIDHNDGKKAAFRLITGGICFGIGFLIPAPWSMLLTLASYIILGYDVVFLGIKNLFKGHMLDENFLMAVASIGAIVIGDYHEATAVMLFYQVGETLQSKALTKSRRSITNLMDIRPDYANILIAGKLQRVAPEAVKTGDVMVIKPGERVPLDGTVLKGESFLDTSALTGESVPRKTTAGDTLLSGSINTSGVLEAQVTAPYAQSTVSRILDLVENSRAQKSKSEQFITRFAKIYTPIVVGLAILLAVVPPLFTGFDFSTWVYRALIFLVVSCPCALVVSVPLGFFAGIGCSAKNGILVKGGNYLEMLSRLDTVVFDKTGTLTEGVFQVTKTEGSEELLKTAAHAEFYSNHPIASSIKKEFGGLIEESALTDYRELAGMGVSVIVDGVQVLAGNGRLMKEHRIPFTSDIKENGTVVHVAKAGSYLGYLIISDKIKADSKEAIKELNRQQINTVMLTGDLPSAAKAIGQELELTEVYGGLLPYDKVSRFEDILSRKNPKKAVAFVGDGINDAPVLARADLGIAMGGLGADSAIEAADLVIMNDEPSRISTGIQISRKTMKIVRQNIMFAFAVKILVMGLSVFGFTNMWVAIFADVGVSLLAVCNSVRAMRYRK